MNLSYPRRQTSVEIASHAAEGRVEYHRHSSSQEPNPRIPPILIFHSAHSIQPFSGPHFEVQRSNN